MDELPTPLVAGNWKMNGLTADLAELDALLAALAGRLDCQVMLCPPHTLLDRACRRAAGTGLMIGGQDCHALAGGAHTGDVAAPMLADLGARAVIVGHSERRSDHGESDALVRAKAEAAHAAGLIAIVCVGEPEAERVADRHEAYVTAQVTGSLPDTASGENTALAYEPIWAIGTGRVAQPGDIGAMHAALRRTLTERLGAVGASVRLLYGGSVKPDNAAAIASIRDVDGMLVGGASLKAADFDAILTAYRS